MSGVWCGDTGGAYCAVPVAFDKGAGLIAAGFAANGGTGGKIILFAPVL